MGIYNVRYIPVLKIPISHLYHREIGIYSTIASDYGILKYAMEQ
ncbi:hypothetical protein [Bacillus nitratireducens]|uniref:Uncharacterized protein n=1 Tax=Bacillus nitratireducens TaxID=2026193 RepID=A0ABU6PIY8_9BACI|nr:hypothetical protein [Bacillus nitratireducens]MED4681258.1 hypothetical protein [Bacillus nitratireducens]